MNENEAYVSHMIMNLLKTKHHYQTVDLNNKYVNLMQMINIQLQLHNSDQRGYANDVERVTKKL